MNIAQLNDFKAMKAQLDEAATMPIEVAKAIKKIDTTLAGFEKRIKFIENQHQAVLENLKK